LLDGRNRLRALLVTGATERFKTLDETYASDNYIGYVLRLNLHRRHLSASQKAALAVEVEKLYAEVAKKRQVEAVKRGNVSRHIESPVPPILAELATTEAPPFELTPSVPEVFTPSQRAAMAVDAMPPAKGVTKRYPL